MKRRTFFAGACASACCLAESRRAFAWDPWGDITHPERIIQNTQKTLEQAAQDSANTVSKAARDAGSTVVDAGKTIDQWRLELNANAGAPALMGWIQASRNDARASSYAVPSDVVRAMAEFGYGPGVTNGVSFRVGGSADWNVANAAIRCGHANAITLIDTICFYNDNAASDYSIWAHELWHVGQYRDWGVWSFAVQYLRSWNGVEGPAYDIQHSFENWWNSGGGQQVAMPPPGFRDMPPQNVNQICQNQFFACAVPPAPSGTGCMCATPYGQMIPGAHP